MFDALRVAVRAFLEAAAEAQRQAQKSLAEVALDVAFEEMRAGASEVGRNNAGPWVAKYHGLSEEEADRRQWSWCAAFVSWCYGEACRRTGIEMPFEHTGGAKTLYRQLVARGWRVSGPPRAGDVVCFDRGQPGSWQGHVGLVVSCDGQTVTTIEGNVGAFPAPIKLKSYTLGSEPRLVGYARVPDTYAIRGDRA